MYSMCLPSTIRLGLAAIACVVASSHAPFSTSAVAQEREVTELVGLDDKVIDFANLKTNSRLVNVLAGRQLAIINSGKTNVPADAADFDKYHLMKLAELTWPGGDPIEEKREDWKRRYLNGQFGNPPKVEWHDRLNALLVKNLPALIADEQISLQSRLNYVILLGQLDKIEFKLNEQPAVPLPEATPLLLAVLNNAALPETLRVAAWTGLARQAELQLSPQVRQTVVAETAKFVAAKKPLEGFSTDGHHWCRKSALQALTGLAKFGNDVSRPETAKALNDIIADAAEPLFLRRDAALALGHLDPASLNGSAVKPPELMKSLAGLTLEVMRAGSASAPAAVLQLSKAEDVFPPPTEESKGLFGHGVAYHLNCIAIALGGRGGKGLKAVPGLDAATAKQWKELYDHIDPLINTFTSPSTSAQKMTADLAVKKDAIEKFVQANALVPQVAAGGGAPPVADGRD
jgi:hypothetical protein